MRELIDDAVSQTYTAIIPASDTWAVFRSNETEERYPVIVWALRKQVYRPDCDLMPEEAGKSGSYTDVVGLIIQQGDSTLVPVDSILFGDFQRYE